MRTLIVLLLLTVAACSSGPPPLPTPGKDADVWDLNPGRWPGYGSNDLIHEANSGTN